MKLFKVNKKNASEVKGRRILFSVFISLIVLILIFMLSVSVGAEKINIWKGLQALFSDEKNFSGIILFKLRLPRSLLVLISGILLGGAGAVFQLFFRNPLAEPGIMGISSGAALGAVVAESFGIGAGLFGIFKFISTVNIFAFAGALASGIIICLVAGVFVKQNSSVVILLCGTALGTFYSACASTIMLTGGNEIRNIYAWLLGSFNGHGWKEVYFIIIPAIISVAMMLLMTNHLDLLTGGEQSAKSLGLNVGRLRIFVLISGALAVSAAVCAGGTISFVGLIAPHIVRKIAGAKGKILIPFSMIFGAALLLLADTIARVVIIPSELPAGIITSLLGVPFFISLVISERK